MNNLNNLIGVYEEDSEEHKFLKQQLKIRLSEIMDGYISEVYTLHTIDNDNLQSYNAANEISKKIPRIDTAANDDLKTDINYIDSVMSQITNFLDKLNILPQHNCVIYGSSIAYAVLSKGNIDNFIQTMTSNESDIDVMISYMKDSPLVHTGIKSYIWNLSAREKNIDDKITLIQKEIIPYLNPKDLRHAITVLERFFRKSEKLSMKCKRFMMDDCLFEIHQIDHKDEIHPANLLRDHLSTFFTITSLMYVHGIGLQSRINIPVNIILNHIKNKQLIIHDYKNALKFKNRDNLLNRIIKYIDRGWNLNLNIIESDISTTDNMVSKKTLQIYYTSILNLIEGECNNCIAYLYNYKYRSACCNENSLDEIINMICENTLVDTICNVHSIRHKRCNVKMVKNIQILRSCIMKYICSIVDEYIQIKDVSNIITLYAGRYNTIVLKEDYINDYINNQHTPNQIYTQSELDLIFDSHIKNFRTPYSLPIN